MKERLLRWFLGVACTGCERLSRGDVEPRALVFGAHGSVTRPGWNSVGLSHVVCGGNLRQLALDRIMFDRRVLSKVICCPEYSLREDGGNQSGKQGLFEEKRELGRSGSRGPTSVEKRTDRFLKVSFLAHSYGARHSSD